MGTNHSALSWVRAELGDAFDHKRVAAISHNRGVELGEEDGAEGGGGSGFGGGLGGNNSCG